MNHYEYRVIRGHYEDRVAERSRVPLMNHIDEGTAILEKMGASMAAIRAFWIHPVLQADADLEENLPHLYFKLDPWVLALALEYRNKANSYLCKPHTDGWDQETLKEVIGSMLPEVRHMLIADKLQNQKDFRLYHKATHPRSAQLEQYFANWLTYLCVDGP